MAIRAHGSAKMFIIWSLEQAQFVLPCRHNIAFLTDKRSALYKMKYTMEAKSAVACQIDAEIMRTSTPDFPG